MARGRTLQCLVQVLVAQALVLQRLRGLGHQQVGQRAQLAAAAGAVACHVAVVVGQRAQTFFLRQRVLR